MKGEKLAIPATNNEQENLERNNGGALTEFFHSYSIFKEDDIDITISGEDKPVELMPLEDFLFITDQLLSGRKINNSERAMEEATVATDQTVMINNRKSNKDDEVTTDSEMSSSAFEVTM